MAIDERARRDLYDQLASCIGSDAADTLMTYLPPVGAGEVVTTQYLDLRLEAMEHRIMASVHQEIGALRGEMATQTRAMVLALISVMLVMTSTMIAAVKL